MNEKKLISLQVYCQSNKNGTYIESIKINKNGAYIGKTRLLHWLQQQKKSQILPPPLLLPKGESFGSCMNYTLK